MEWSVFDSRGRRKYMVPEERAAFLRAAYALGAETATFCAVLSFTGARVSEALALTPLDLDEVNGTINIRTLKQRKTGAVRDVPVPRELFPFLDGVHLWRAARQDLASVNRRLWVFSRTTAWRRVRQVAKRAGIPDYLSHPHALRHSFGATARINEVPIELIQFCLGHVRIETTYIYTKVVGPHQRDFIGRTWRESLEFLRISAG
ncbi:MAG TPA: site-specific integrase [Rhizomicrobium sp.]|nr:site-specific integrase [Rhizomicrobium sp.]